MLVVIVRLHGLRYEMSFLPGEQKAAEQIAKRYGTTVYQPGALLDCGGTAGRARTLSYIPKG